MKKGTKGFALFALGLVLTSFLIGVVSAVDLVSPAINKFNAIISGTSVDYVKDILSPEILFAILIFLIIFAIIDQIPLFKQPWIKITLSIVVSILAAGFISVDWIKPLLNQYTAIGVAISFLLPLVLLFYFVKEMAPNNYFIQRIIWTTFFLVVGINAILNWTSLDSKLTRVLYFVLIITSLIMIFLSKTIFKKLFEEDVKKGLSSWKMMQQLIREGDKAKAIEYAKTINMTSGRKAQIAKSLGINASDL